MIFFNYYSLKSTDNVGEKIQFSIVPRRSGAVVLIRGWGREQGDSDAENAPAGLA
jgi:hypothetical protein